MRVSERGQITIPKHLRERFGLHHDVEVTIRATEDGLLIQKKAEDKPAVNPSVDGVSPFADRGDDPVSRVAGILDGTDFDIDEYIKEIRGR